MFYFLFQQILEIQDGDRNSIEVLILDEKKLRQDNAFRIKENSPGQKKIKVKYKTGQCNMIDTVRF